MAQKTQVISNLNDTLPPPPVGYKNVNWQVDRTVSPPNISANVEIPVKIATFLLGLGGAVGASSNVAPVYRVKEAGTVIKCAVKAKTALADAVSFMVQRNRGGTVVNILSAVLTITATATAWFETTAFDNADLAVGDELQLNITAGVAENVTLELHWR